MKKMTANFYPYNATNEESRTLGFADLTIGNAVRINGITVFKNAEGDGINIMFPGFGEGGSYVVPKSKEMYAAMHEVISMAMKNDKHFGYNKGEYGVRFDVQGKVVNEPYADGRFSVDVSDVCTLYGVTTRPVEYTNDEGKNRSFVAVDFPNIGSYEKDGATQYRYAFEGRTSSWKDKDGNEKSFDYGQLMQGLVLSERKDLLKDRKPELGKQMQEAEGKKDAPKSVSARNKEAERG